VIALKQSENGFSLLEILTVLVVTTVIIIPLMRTLYGNFEINNRTQTRRDATSIAEGSIDALQKLDFDDFQDQLDIVNGNSTYIIEMDQNTCADVNFLLTSNDRSLCTQIFSTIWNNLTLDENSFKMYLFDYALSNTQYNSIINNGSIEPMVIETIESDEDIQDSIGDPAVDGLIRVIVWIDYYDEPDLEITLTGLIADD
jgi:hypothetical protein